MMRELWLTDKPRFYFIKKCVYFYDIELFAKEVLTRWTRDKKTGEKFDTPDFHKEMWVVDDSDQDTLFIVPRGFAKTTARSKIKVLHSKLYQYEPATLIISSEGLGEEIVGDIQQELETNKKIHLIWGNLVPSSERNEGEFSARKWKRKHLQLKNGTEIETISKGGSLRGKRPTEIVIDDPQEDKDVKNPRIALEYWNWVWSSVYNMLVDGGKFTVLGTILSENCFVNMLKQDADERGFKVIEYPAIKLEIEDGVDPFKIELSEYFEKGTALWPKRWSMEKLKRRAKKIGEAAFWQEFMHKPMIKNGKPVFSQEYVYKVMPVYKEVDGIQYFRRLTKVVDGPNGKKIREPLYYGSIGMDFASGKTTGDYQAITVRSTKGELLAMYRGKIAQDLLCPIVSKLVSQLKGYTIVPERNYGQVFLKEALKYPWVNNVYRKQTYDRILKKESEELGFWSSEATKTIVINQLDQMFREGNWEVSKEEREEIEKYYHDEKGGMNAISPYHDDTIIADAMCVLGMQTGINAPLLSFA